MATAIRLSQQIDEKNDRFTNDTKDRLLGNLSDIDTDTLEWLVMEHYQFSFTNVAILNSAVVCTAKLAEQGVTVELQRNVDEEDGHSRMYKQAMLAVGTDVDRRVEFVPTTEFLNRVRNLSSPNPSCALGALYATEAAAIFEHETFDEICREICRRRGVAYEGSTIKDFHDLHLDGGVEQGHKDGLAAFVDIDESDAPTGQGMRLNKDEVRQGALEAIGAMQVWWDNLLGRVLVSPASG